MAEGYLDLLMVFDDCWPLDVPHRQILADRAMKCLKEIRNPQGYKPYILFLKGQSASAALRYHEAVKYLLQSAQLDPDNVHCQLSLGWCYKRIDRVDLAIEAMEAAIRIDGQCGLAHYNLACYWALARQPKMAVLHLTSALELNPEFRALVEQETDFDNIRLDPDFLALTTLIA
jgi:tetratricopeptide (TPR) repeat protein